MKRRQFLALSALLPLAPGALRAAGDDLIKIRDLYNKNLSLSPLARSAEGTRIRVEGFMAPPLKAESTFFVLTKKPMAVCPFCETEAEWPNDILAIYTKRVVDVKPFNVKIVTSGTLETGAYKDPDTGFLSMVRLVDATVSGT
ncbi:hypothetical protein [Tropicimonas sp.]|uniref:hypothetical protein n=1 Tax=Tropicimonas sp. TaxID=2067044 RepID=UPI003A874EFD